KGFKALPAVCYEIAYPFYIQKMVKNADFIITVSNDTWFGSSIGPVQHLQIAQFRAKETGRYVLRATNTGITAVIAPNGAISSEVAQFQKAVLNDNIIPLKGLTPWVAFGPWPLLLSLSVVFVLAIGLDRKK